MAKMGKYRVAILSIGNEILLGKTLNTNLSWLATQLAEIGLEVFENVVIKDDETQIIETLRRVWNTYDIVICTGGLGPTVDDITKTTVSRFFDKELVFDPDLWEKVQQMFTKRGIATPEINRNQALVPMSFEVLPNEYGTAPGLLYQDGRRSFFALPGVPIEMKYIYTNSMAGLLGKIYPSTPIYQKTLHTWATSESAMAELLQGLQIPSNVRMAWLPQTGRVDLRFYGSDKDRIDGVCAEVRNHLGNKIWGEDSETPYTVLHSMLIKQAKTLSVAESCSGGLLQALITEQSGSSKYLLGGIIAYSNDIKSMILNVNEDTLHNYGAVSSETAIEMAVGIKKLTNSDLGISVTGIAGPDGGSDQKPVGTVYFAIADDSGTRSFKQYFSGDRSSVRIKATDFLVLQLIDRLKG